MTADDRGSATLVAAAMCAALLAVTSGGAVLAAVVVARHRAQAVADLAALAAAARLPQGQAAACGSAGRLALTMHTTLADCAVDGLDVVVRTEAEVALGGDWVGPASASARAGPSGPDG
ncbi:helicase [Mycolicibacterium parafortuitum]|nr:Rv3654c family TadE-like protein [Mycolicibacterium parafortuitum]ORB32093.1 helicase [Mycolicibacterium parafortuitum]